MKNYFSSISTAILLSVIFAGCSKSDKGLWDDAVKYQKDQKVTEAINSYEQVFEKHPDSPLAPKALFEIGKLYQSRSVKDFNTVAALNKAIEYYGKIFNQYPNSEEAPKALFMKGFIQSNELQDFPAAKSSFTIFIQKYPKNEMIPSAKAELENMGKPPEEILKEEEVGKK
jgi:TolA-binding protein